MHAVRPIVMFCGMVLIAGSAVARKGEDRISLEGPRSPVFRASENVGLDVASGLPALTTGALDADDSTYNRQAGNCSGLSGIGTDVFYDTVTLTNTSGVVTALDVTTSDVGDPTSCTQGDTYLSVYSPTFNAVAPTTNCVTSNDDGGPGVCSSVSFDLEPGHTAIVVVASYGNGALFDYQVNLDSPSCVGGLVHDDGTLEAGIRGPAGSAIFEVDQRFDLPMVGAQGASLQRVCACLSHTVSAIDDFPINLVLRRVAGDGEPGARIHTESVMALDVPDFPSCQFCITDLAGVDFDEDEVYIGVEWNQMLSPELLVAADTSSAAATPTYFTTDSGSSWSPATDLDPSFENLGVRAVVAEPFTALSSTPGLLVPGYVIDMDATSLDPTTFLALHNTTDGTLEANLEYHGEEVLDDPLRTDGLTLAPRAVAPWDIRFDLSDLDPDGDGVASGLVVARRPDTADASDLEGDFFSVTRGDAFASGDRLFRIPGDFCDLAEIRYVDFGSGTLLKILVDKPRGDVEPSFTYVVTDEAGTVLGTGDYYTGTHLNVLDATELAGPGQPSGNVVFDFGAAGGGFVIARYSAFGLFSVELNSACRD